MERTRKLHLELLLIRIRRGDPSALTELVKEWEPPLLAYLRRLLPSEDEAWDVLQETWIKAMRGLGDVRDLDAFPPWIYRIARNTAISHFRTRRPTEDPSDDDPLTAETSDPEFSPEEFEAVHRAIENLSFHHREAIVLHFLDDLTIVEIAALLDIPPGTVKSRIHHGKRRIRQIIQRERTSHEAS
jgi:RNA polymerase sigma-70 factor (ECF subfamily)